MAPQRNENRPKVRLTLEGFRVLRRGESGYSPTARKYINETSGEIISVRQFQKMAQRIPVEPSPRPSSRPTTPTPTARPQRPEPLSFGVEINREERYYAVMRDLERGVSLSRSLKFHHISKKSFFDELSQHENAEAIVDTRFRNRPTHYHVELLKPKNSRSVTVQKGVRAGLTYEINDGYTVFPQPLPTFQIITDSGSIRQVSCDYRYAGQVGVWGNWVRDVLNSSGNVPLPPGFNPVVRDARGNVIILNTSPSAIRSLFAAMSEMQRRQFTEDFYVLMMLGLV